MFDFTDDSWKANAAAAGNPKLSATEWSDAGDADESLYATDPYQLMNLNGQADPVEVIVQAVDDLAVDEIVSTESMWVASGRNFTRPLHR